MGKQHQLIAGQMKSELEEPLTAFAGGMKERRKIVQTGIERLLKTKQGQTMHVNKVRDKYEQDCLRIKGYLAQGHMVMGQEERKNKAKLEKTQINMASNSNEYESAIKVLEETTGRWNKEWKAACDKFQDLEEERIDFMKSSLWSFANIASTVCVSDDASCEKVRLSLENCEVEKDITGFIRDSGTGQEIPDPPRFINFARGDVNDTASEASEDESYSVAQFQRNTKPEYRSSSPNPSSFGGSQVPQSELSQRMNHHGQAEFEEDEDATPSRANSGRPPPLNYRQADPNVPPNYSPSAHGDVPTKVPHNEYPTEGMTMFCRAGPPSVNGSNLSSNTRPSSRDSQSEYSNPTSYTSAEPMSGKNSPTKGNPPVNGVGMPGMTSHASPDKAVQKKRSGFFSNSPFRRKSRKDTDHQAHTTNPNRSTFSGPTNSSRINLTPSNVTSSSQQSSPTKSSPTRPNLFSRHGQQPPEGEEPADPRASFQLNVGNNVFDVASPDSQTTPKAGSASKRHSRFPAPSHAGDDLSMDPIAQALADLKSGGNGMNKQASMRVQADRYHGVQTPAPDAAVSRPAPLSAQIQDRMAAQRGTPPPAYEGSRGGGAPGLGVPQPAFTSKEMRSRTENWGGRPGSAAQGNMRARSPGPGLPRATSPQPMRARSPAPDMMRARSPGPAGMVHNQVTHGGQYRSQSPNPFGGGQGRRQNSGGMEMQLSSSEVQRYGPDSYGSGRSRQGMANGNGGRPQSAYGSEYGAGGRGTPMDPQMRRERSKSMAPQPQQQKILHYGKELPSHGLEAERVLTSWGIARALYSYTAAIPEELTFAKGDVLAVLRLQDDGWWEAEISKGRIGVGNVGLVPSNYLQRC